MEFASKLRWILVVFILLFVMILVGWGLASIARNIFDGPNGGTTVVDETDGVVIEDAEIVSYTVDGPVVASTDHRSYIIEVTRNMVSMRVYSDYGQKIIDQASYTNNSEAYETFIQSLDKANATARIEGTTVDDDQNDAGACPKGKRYILEIGEFIRRWDTSCEGIEGTAGGKMTTIRELFNKQVPDYTELVADTGLNAQ